MASRKRLEQAGKTGGAHSRPAVQRGGSQMGLASAIGNQGMLKLLGKGRGAPSEKDSRTGIPPEVKAELELKSGVPLDDVAVHYASARPAAFGALGYAQGADVYLGPGEERHLKHELGHVIQQKQGRVRPNARLNGHGVNLDQGMEHEADAPQRGPEHPSPSEPLMQFRLDKKDLEAIWNAGLPREEIRELKMLYDDNADTIQYGKTKIGGEATIAGDRFSLKIGGRRGWLGRLFGDCIPEDPTAERIRRSVIVHELTHLAEARANMARNPAFRAVRGGNIIEMARPGFKQSKMTERLFAINDALREERAVFQGTPWKHEDADHLMSWVGQRLFYAIRNEFREYPAVLNELNYLLHSFTPPISTSHTAQLIQQFATEAYQNRRERGRRQRRPARHRFRRRPPRRRYHRRR